MVEKSLYEKYLAGEPVNEELAELKNNLTQNRAQPANSAEKQESRQIDGELTRSERVALKELRMAPGWAILQRLLEKIAKVQEQSAIVLSKNDPLGRSTEIANEWAYLQMMNRARITINYAVDAEIALLGEGREQ
jgi:hypothetical protein